MNVVKRVEKKEFENEVEDKQAEGYKVESKTERQAVLVKRNYGRALWHVLIFVVTVWFTLGLVNLAYLLFAYFVQKDELTIKINQKG